MKSSTVRVAALAYVGLLCTACGEWWDGGAPCGGHPSFVAYPCWEQAGGTAGQDGKTTLRVGQTLTLTLPPGDGVVGTLSLGGANACPVADTLWASSNPGVAGVEGTSSGGASTASVRALAPGTTEITALVKWNAGTTGTVAAGFSRGGFISGSEPRACTVTVTS